MKAKISRHYADYFEQRGYQGTVSDLSRNYNEFRHIGPYWQDRNNLEIDFNRQPHKPRNGIGRYYSMLLIMLNIICTVDVSTNNSVKKRRTS